MTSLSRLQTIINLHFDPNHGSAYWLKKEKKLGFSVRDQIQQKKDLYKLGSMELDDLTNRPIEEFIPIKFLKEKRPLIFCETGGTIGTPKTTAYFKDEFEEIFVHPFTQVAQHLGFSGKGRWLWIGPGGPHVIGKASHAIAQKLSGADPFSIDFDPRWYRKLAPKSIARNRYMNHVTSQAIRILNTQLIENLFTTPIVLESISSLLNKTIREKIKGIYIGGMSISKEAIKKIKNSFPNAVLIPGYGNSLFGVCHGLKDLKEEPSQIIYYSHSERLQIELISLDKSIPLNERLKTPIEPNQRGQVLFHRLDESVFLPNVLERDTGIRNAINEESIALGCLWDGIADPQPLNNLTLKVEGGIY